MKILVLEDDRTRWKLMRPFIQELSCDFIWARTVVEALQALNAHSFDLVFLDHDLEFGPGNSYCSMSTGDGMDVAKHMVKLEMKCVAVVHSLNRVAGPYMHQTLVEGGINSILAQGFWMDGTWDKVRAAIRELGGN